VLQSFDRAGYSEGSCRWSEQRNELNNLGLGIYEELQHAKHRFLLQYQLLLEVEDAILLTASSRDFGRQST
jgi:hypothetical protein